jgi:hypothetical protein
MRASQRRRLPQGYDNVRGEGEVRAGSRYCDDLRLSRRDSLALTLNGTIHWPPKTEARRTKPGAGGSLARIRQILEGIGDAIFTVAAEVRLT